MPYWKRRDPAPRAGFYKLERSYESLLIRRFGPTGAWLIVGILERTSGAFGEPEWAELDSEDLSTTYGVTVRHIKNLLKPLIRLGVISAHPDDSWTFKAHPERFSAAPVRAPVLKPDRKCSPRKPAAAADSARSEMDFRSNAEPAAEIHFQPNAPRGQLVGIAPPAPPSEIPLPESEIHFREPETYCHWEWKCPYLDNELPISKTLKTRETTSSSSSEDHEPSDKDQRESLVSEGSGGNSPQRAEDLPIDGLGKASGCDGVGAPPENDPEVWFLDRIAQLFALNGKPLPTKAQAGQIWKSLSADARPLFIAWLSELDAKRWRRIEHPGILPSLAKEFLAVSAYFARKSQHVTQPTIASDNTVELPAEYWTERERLQRTGDLAGVGALDAKWLDSR